MILSAVLVLVIGDAVYGDYVIRPLVNGVAQMDLRRGAAFDVDVVLTSNANDTHNGATFRLVFSAPGIVVESYTWTQPFVTGSIGDASVPAAANLPVALTDQTVGAAGSDVDMEFENASPGFFGVGTLLTIACRVPGDYAGLGIVAIAIDTITIANGFNPIDVAATADLQLQIETKAVMAISPANRIVSVGDDFDIAVTIDAGARTVDGASLFLNFDPAVVHVNHVALGTALPQAIGAAVLDNSQGHVDVSAGAPINRPSGTFTVVTIQCTALTLGSSAIAFNRSTNTNNRVTAIASAGQSILGPTDEGLVTVFLDATADCNDNDTIDEQEIADGHANDTDTNGIPDDCQPNVTVLRLKPGWSLVSLSVNPDAPSKSTLRENSSSTAWTWAGARFAAVDVAAMKADGRGYWYHYNGSSDLMMTISGAIPATTNVAVTVGWNLIGVFEDYRTLPVDVVNGPRLWGWNGARLASPAELLRGNGFWTYRRVGADDLFGN